MDAAASPASSTNRAAEAGSAGSSADSAASTELVVKVGVWRTLSTQSWRFDWSFLSVCVLVETLCPSVLNGCVLFMLTIHSLLEMGRGT